MTVKCSTCRQEWERDPALEVICPTCRAEVGRGCQRPSGHSGPFVEIHKERDVLAMQEIPGYGKCPARKENKQATMFEEVQQ